MTAIATRSSAAAAPGLTAGAMATAAGRRGAETSGSWTGDHLQHAACCGGTAVNLHPGLRRGTMRWRRIAGSEAGMATAEYAIATLAAVGFAGLLVFILRSDEVRGFLLTLIRTALALP